MNSQPELANEEGNSNLEIKTHQGGGEGASFLELMGTIRYCLLGPSGLRKRFAMIC